MADTGSGSSAVIPVPATEAALLFDTNGEVWGFTLQNIDPTNSAYASQDRQQLNSSGSGGALATTPNVGIQLNSVSGSWTVMWFRGRMYARAQNATVGVRVEVWPVHMFDPKIFADLAAVLKGMMAFLMKKDVTK